MKVCSLIKPDSSEGAGAVHGLELLLLTGAGRALIPAAGLRCHTHNWWDWLGMAGFGFLIFLAGNCSLH